LREDERRVLLGEDVKNGGMLGLSRAALGDEALRARVIGSPLTSAAQITHAAGLAQAGMRPIVCLPSSGALLEGLAALRELGRLRWRSAGAIDLPVLFLAPDGPGFGLGGEAAESVEATLARVPGLELLIAGRGRESAAFVRSAASFESSPPELDSWGPRVVLLPRSVVLREVDSAELDIHADLEREPTASLRHGSAATVFAWGGALEPALAAAEACASDEDGPTEVEVVDVARLAPLDEALLVERASATGKIVIAHCGSRKHGVGAELAALFADQAILHLDAPILRVCGEHELVAGHEEHLHSPPAAAIAEAILQVVHY
jgi:pyruvate/2-oxoglutarate/acetoin dehydrogenase E1 component